MWNLSYGRYGERIKLGTKADPGQTKRAAKKKKPVKLTRKAKQAFHIKHDAYEVPRRERMLFLQTGLTKGAQIPSALLRQRRNEFDKQRHTLLPLKGKRCYLCTDPARHRHHIVPLYLGGSNALSNLVPLCCPCHGKLHPWLTENLSMAAGILPASASDLQASS